MLGKKHRLLNIRRCCPQSPIIISGRLLDFTLSHELSRWGQQPQVYLVALLGQGVVGQWRGDGLDLFDSCCGTLGLGQRELALGGRGLSGLHHRVRGDPLPLLPGGAGKLQRQRQELRCHLWSTPTWTGWRWSTTSNGRIDHTRRATVNAKRLLQRGDTVDAGECYYKEKLQ